MLRSRSLWSAAALLVGCAPSPARCPTEGAAAPGAPFVPVVVGAVPTPRTPPAESAAPGASPCWARGRPRARPPKSGAEPTYCAALDMFEVPRAEARIRKEFVVRDKPSKLVVDFGCDVAYGTLRELVFEDGSGHGGTLRIVRFSRDGARYAVRVIDYRHYGTRALAIRAGEVDAPALDAVVARSRVMMLARPHLVRLLDPRITTISLSAIGTSSHDFHVKISLVDDDGRVTERGFTGYETPQEQERYLPMTLAIEPIQNLVAGAQLATVTATDDDRAFFTERMLATFEGGTPSWWIKERYVALAAELGTVDVVPLLGILAATTEGNDASIDRTREAALDAITAITGWSPRVDERGEARSAGAAGAAARDACLDGAAAAARPQPRGSANPDRGFAP